MKRLFSAMYIEIVDKDVVLRPIIRPDKVSRQLAAFR